MLWLVLVLAALVGCQSSAAPPFDPEFYRCAACRRVLMLVVGNSSEQAASQFCLEFPGTCDRIGRAAITSFQERTASLPVPMSLQATVLRECQLLDQCPLREGWQDDAELAQMLRGIASVDLRVAKAMGSRGYNALRISVVNNIATHVLYPQFFNGSSAYAAGFRHRWTDKHVQSVLKTAHAGNNTFALDARTSITVNLPADGAGIRGIMIADPCFSEQFTHCAFGGPYKTFSRTTALFNSFLANNELSFYGILGDNFYDGDGSLTSQWFDQLTLAAKSKIMISVPGNHDFWVLGKPSKETPEDQYGNGQMQFYTQDTMAAIDKPSQPFDFSVNPDDEQKVAAVSNFFFYHKLGNVAFIGFSGAHSFAKTKDYFAEACAWVGTQNPALVLLLGHWSQVSSGCKTDMDVPTVYSAISTMPGCDRLGKKLKYLMGHTHCTLVTQKDTGFQLGGQGQDESDCSVGNYGIPILDTTGGRARIMYFPIQDKKGTDNYDALQSCLNSPGGGYTKCLHFAVPLLNVSLAELET